MSDKIPLTKEAYLEHVIYGKANHADKCRLFGKNAVNDFVNANQAWIQEQWDAKRKPTPKFVHPVKHEGKVEGQTGRPSVPMTREAAREAKTKQWADLKLKKSLRETLDRSTMTVDDVVALVLSHAEDDPATARWLIEMAVGKPDAKVTMDVGEGTIFQVFAVVISERYGAEAAGMILSEVETRLGDSSGSDPEG